MEKQRSLARRLCAGSSWLGIVMILAVAVLILVAAVATNFGEDLSLATVQGGADALQTYSRTHYAWAAVTFVFAYVAINLWFPGAVVMGLLSGFLFGTALGAVYVEVGTTVGAVLAFEASRNIAANWVQHKWHHKLQGFNRALSKHGDKYLLLVRLFPVIPFFMVNVFTGLTRVQLTTFVWTTALGSLPGTLILCYAGRQLRALKSANQIMTIEVVIALVLLAAFACSAIPLRRMLNRCKD